MITAAELEPGMALRLEGHIYKVMAAEFKAGAGQLGGVVKTKLRHVENGRFLEPHFRPDERLENLEVERQPMQFLYGDAETATFMNLQNYEQVEIPRAAVGPAGKFLHAEMTVAVEFHEGNAVSVEFPPVVEARIAETAPAAHSQQDSTWKEAKLENGAVIMVPLFIDRGEMVHVDVATERYLDRVKMAKKRGA
jgi:elongation factor P